MIVRFMATLDNVLDIIPALGIILALVYYTLTVRNQNKTRQAQLLMGLYENYRSPEFRRMCQQIGRWEWTDFEDFWEKYGEENNPDAWNIWESVAAFYNGVGVLLRNGLIDIKLVDDLLYNVVQRDWPRMGPIIVEWRKYLRARYGERERKHDNWGGFDYLHEELERYLKEHPELKA
jgi:hypothetical protein